MRDALKTLNAILERDSKDTTYKFALLRALVEISEEAEQHMIGGDAEVVRFPLGLLVEKWLFYYYPLVEAGVPQRHGEDPADGTRAQLSFRRELFSITSFYRESGGGMPEFFNDYRRGTIPDAVRGDLLTVLKKIRDTITRYPMKHLGYSVFKRHYAVVDYARSERLNLHGLKNGAFDSREVIRRFGAYELKREFHDLFRVLAGLVTGREAIVYQWALFTSHAQPALPISVNRALDLLLQEPAADRRVGAAMSVYHDWWDRRHELQCVWTGRQIGDPKLLNVDHVIPFSIWGNNDLWNLLPTHKKTNASKHDRVPAPELIDKRKDHIIEYWDALNSSYPEAFRKELELSIIGVNCERPASEMLLAGIKGLTRKCRYLIEERGFEPWSP